jgi:hypothetical protein
LCLAQRELFGPFFFAESTANGTVFLDMLEESLMPILGADGMLLQQDAEPSHFHKEMTDIFKWQASRKMYFQGRTYHLVTSFA